MPATSARRPLPSGWIACRASRALERDQNIQIETLALFIRYFLTVSTPVPEAHQDAARAQGKARFEQFVEQLGRHLLRGRSLVRDVVEELHPDPMRMEDAAAARKRRSVPHERRRLHPSPPPRWTAASRCCARRWGR
jgi:hypothetical protein